jgi:hypothetical protein
MGKFLRIAISATCLVACVLLIALWGRSYSSIGSLKTRYYLLEVFVSTRRGIVTTDVNVNQTSDSANIPNVEWVINSFPIREKVTYYLGDTRRVRSFLGFRWNSGQSIYEVSLPFWFLVLPIATLGIIPWIRQLHWRFTLRTLLIVMTLVAVVLGLIVAVVRWPAS